MPRSALTKHVVASRLWGDSDFCLIDVGASGGIHNRWSVFGDRLTAVGFDPLVSEVDRLNALESREKVRYETAFVGCRDLDRLFPPGVQNDRVATRFNQPYERSSTVAAHRILQQDYVRDVFNSGADVVYSTRRISLDEYVASSSPQIRPDFLKIDTDGDDFHVLLGAEALVESHALLGIEIEVQFHGAVHEFANGFSNIDRFLRERGFSLFDLTPYRYSRAALPAPFALGIAAQTDSGQVNWGEALYFRDLGQPLYERMFGVEPSVERLLKLCCLFEAYDLGDCAAELLVSCEGLRALPQQAALLDLLTPRLFGDEHYDDYIKRFNERPLDWLPANIARKHEPVAETTVSTETPSPETPSPRPDERMRDDPTENMRQEKVRLNETVAKLKRRVQRLRHQNAELRERLRKREERLALIKRRREAGK